LKDSIRDDTILVSLMAANNEIGTLHPIARIAEIVETTNALLHIDAAQSLTYGSIDLSEVPADLVSISGHKMYGPKGVGALYVRGSALPHLAPTMFGGGHERGVRSGTLNVPAIVGLGAASSIVRRQRHEDAAAVARLRDSLQDALMRALPDLEIIGIDASRHPGNLNVIFRGVDAQTLLNRLRNVVAASTGSACTAATPEASHVLIACGFTHDEGMSAVRFGIGRQNTPEEIAAAASAVVENVRFLRTTTEPERGSP
jgi:cysteine desulfurase